MPLPVVYLIDLFLIRILRFQLHITATAGQPFLPSGPAVPTGPGAVRWNISFTFAFERFVHPLGRWAGRNIVLYIWNRWARGGGVLLLVIGHWLWYGSGCLARRRWGGPAPVAMVVAALRDGFRNGCRGVPRCAPRRRSQWNADRTDTGRQTPRFISQNFI